MANFTALKTAIQNVIKQNGNEEITGDVLQQILLSIVSTMGDGAINTIEQNLSNETLARQNGDNTLQQNINSEALARGNADTQLQSNINSEALARGNADTQLQNAINAIKADIDNGYVYAGIAAPSSTPVSGKVFYIATAAGTYTNFGGQVLTQGINILRYNGSAWSNQQLIGIDDVPTVGSGNLVKSSGVQNELALGAVYDVSAKNPTGGPNNDGKWESISALLSDANLNTLIPTAYRKGGMSIKFVHTSDNKYVQARCMAQNFTTDVTQWAIAEEGVYIENPEFVYVKTDKDDKILWAIKTDGSIYYGAGVPPQIVNYINEKIAELSLDEYEDIVAFLDDLEKGDKTLQDLLNEKVDEEEGKSLIDAEYANGVRYIENPEFAEVKLDADDRILEATMLDGVKLLPAGYEVGGNVVKTISNPEYLAAWLDSTGHILFALKVDGDVIFGCGVPSQIKEHVSERIKPFEKLFHYEDSPEFMEVELDADDKVLSGRKVDGTKFENNNVELNGNATVGGSLEVDGVVIKRIEDPEERLEIATDSENKIISYRKDDGTLVENVGIETNHLELTGQGMSDFQKALKDSGFTSGAGDWSDYISNDGDNPLHLPIPTLAIVNIIVDYDLKKLSKAGRYEGREGVNYDIPAIIQYWDCLGNYFKKNALISGQGNATMEGTKKNIAIDLFDTEDMDGAFSIKFGNWVAQDSFHLKANVSTNFRFLNDFAYKYYNKIVETRGIDKDYIWKRGIGGIDSIAPDSNADKDNSLNVWETGATCVPDGFPMVLYHNGEFWGLYTWNIKKHRDNYHMDKKEAKHIHLDSVINSETLFTGDSIDWDIFCGNTIDSGGRRDGIEIRNPKNLYCINVVSHYEVLTDLTEITNVMKRKSYSQTYVNCTIDITAIPLSEVEAMYPEVLPIYFHNTVADEWYKLVSVQSTGCSKYDADFNCHELIDSTMLCYDSTNKDHVRTNKVKHSIENFAKSVVRINAHIPSYTRPDEEVITLTKCGGDYDNTVSYSRGEWVISVENDETKYYMSLHNLNTHSLTDTDYWLDVTSDIIAAKEAFETYYDVDSLIDYNIFSDVVDNWDGFAGKNWQWVSYDGVKLHVCPYDCELILGYNSANNITSPRSTFIHNYSQKTNLMNIPLFQLYNLELDARYKELRDKGIIDSNYITNMLKGYIDAYGKDNYEREWTKWNSSMPYDNIYRVKKWLDEKIVITDNLYNYNLNV